MIKRLLFCVLMLCWLAALPIAFLAIGMSDFEALSPLGLLRDVAALPASMTLVAARLLVWAYLLFPALGCFVLVRERRRQGA